MYTDAVRFRTHTINHSFLAIKHCHTNNYFPCTPLVTHPLHWLHRPHWLGYFSDFLCSFHTADTDNCPCRRSELGITLNCFCFSQLLRLILSFIAGVLPVLSAHYISAHGALYHVVNAAKFLSGLQYHSPLQFVGCLPPCSARCLRYSYHSSLARVKSVNSAMADVTWHGSCGRSIALLTHRLRDSSTALTNTHFSNSLRLM